MVVAEIMTTEAVVVDPTATAREAIRTMFDAGVRHLPVVDDDELVGFLSDRDLRGLRLPQPEAGADFEPLEQTVSELMSSDVLTVTPESDVAEVVDLMLEHKVGAVPVVREGTQELVGVVSYVDVLRVARDLL